MRARDLVIRAAWAGGLLLVTRCSRSCVRVTDLPPYVALFLFLWAWSSDVSLSCSGPLMFMLLYSLRRNPSFSLSSSLLESTLCFYHAAQVSKDESVIQSSRSVTTPQQYHGSPPSSVSGTHCPRRHPHADASSEA